MLLSTISISSSEVQVDVIHRETRNIFDQLSNKNMLLTGTICKFICKNLSAEQSP